MLAFLWSLLILTVSRARALWTDCNLDDVIDTSSLPLLSDFWGSFVKNASNIHVDSGTSLEEGRFFKRWAYILTRTDEMLDAVVRDCLFGVLTLLLQALPAVDYESGRAEALVMLGTAKAIFQQAQTIDGFDDVVQEAEALGWDVASLLGALQLYDALLAEAPEETASTAEACSGPRLYVYPPPPGSPGEAAVTAKRLLHGGPGGYLPALAGGPLQCVFGMYGTEYLYHQHFRDSPCRVGRPEDADLFFVPSYFKCIEVLNFVEHFNAEENEADILLGQTVEHMRGAGPWFDRHDGADHVFLFSWGRFPCRLANWRLHLRSAIALQVEDHCEDLNSESPQPTFSRWKDIIIPGHIDQWRVLELRRRNKPFERRDVLLVFHGRHAGNTDSYENVTVRSKILELEGLPGVSVGGFIDGYHELLGESIFCLAPRGITPWTIHLYVAVLAGCIPVILSDEYEVPFQDIVDWPTFSVKWPAQGVGRELYDYLASLEPRLLREMKRKVDEHACWFDYYSRDPTCSPYVAVARALQERVARRPRYVGRYWGPGGAALPGRDR